MCPEIMNSNLLPGILTKYISYLVADLTLALASCLVNLAWKHAIRPHVEGLVARWDTDECWKMFLCVVAKSKKKSSLRGTMSSARPAGTVQTSYRGPGHQGQLTEWAEFLVSKSLTLSFRSTVGRIWWFSQLAQEKPTVTVSPSICVVEISK